MGIRFSCPNGHKLNVKSFQAGKRGICPYCGAKFTVPTQSILETKDQKDEAAKQISDVGPRIELPSIEVPLPEPPQAKKNQADPLAEDPQAVWYVRPPSGGQFGPAEADVMRTWIKEGRVTADSLVWREGWRDWAEAVKVFPKLALRRWLPEEGEADVPPPPPLDKLKLETKDVKTGETAAKPGGRTSRRLTGGRGKILTAREKKERQIIIVVALSVAAVALAGVLVWVLMR